MLIYTFYANLSNNLSYLMFKFLLVSLALFVLSACSKSTDEEITIPPEEGIHDQNRPVIYVETGSRCVLQNQQTQSTSNPSLFTDWEGCETVALNKAGSFATLPWRDGCSTTLSTTFRYNIKKTDGWQMAFSGRLLILSPWPYDGGKRHISRADCVALNEIAEEICNCLNKQPCNDNR